MGNKPIRPTILLDKGMRNTWDQRSGSSPARTGTCHHIVPYRYLSFTGYLIEKYLDTQPGNDRLSDREEGILNRILKDNHFSKSAGKASVRLGWMTPNLFEGPAPLLRADDPGNDCEKNQPVSMIQDGRWQQLQVIRREIEGIASFTMQGNQSHAMPTWTTLHANVERDIGVQDLGNLLIHFEPLFKYPHVHRFRNRDWILMAPKGAPDNQKKPGWFNPEQPFTPEVLKKYRWLGPGGLEYYMPMTEESEESKKSDKRPYLWRLRRTSNDPAPRPEHCPNVQKPLLSPATPKQ